MNENNAGLILNLWLIMRRYNRVLAATGNVKQANRAAWHTYGLIWLAGWAIIAPCLCFLFGLGGAWGFDVIGAVLAVVLIPALLYASYRDRAWEAKLTAQAIEPPPIPTYQSVDPPPAPRTEQVLTAFYRPPQRRIRSAR